jgi:hypothetical protein
MGKQAVLNNFIIFGNIRERILAGCPNSMKIKYVRLNAY